MMKKLSQLPNMKGIKSGDLILIKTLHDDASLKKDFLPIFSGSDLFAVAQAYGIKRYLDGIFACFPALIREIQEHFDRNELLEASSGLNKMMQARDEMIAMGIWPAFSHAMNVLGYEGNFAPDYEPELDTDGKKKVEQILLECGEL
jgi:4-hydroxy-tetrahydrodipicolinate synthase